MEYTDNKNVNEVKEELKGTTTIDSTETLSNIKSSEVELASRWARFVASFIDALIMGVVVGIFAYFTGGFDMLLGEIESSLSYEIGIVLLSIVVFIAINYKLLITKGQTVGKKVFNIQVVDLEDNVPTKKSLLNRYLVYMGIQHIPVIGGIFAFINVLFIFGKEKRCIHDISAKTKVIKVRN